MLKGKIQAAVEDLKKVYNEILVRPGAENGTIDITLTPGNLHDTTGDHAAFSILKKHGLQAHGFTASQQISKLFLRGIREVENHQSEIGNQQSAGEAAQ